MDNDVAILLVLAALALFLLFRLRSVLGEKTGFDDPESYRRSVPESPEESNVVVPMRRPDGARDDSDIFAYAEPDSPLGRGLLELKEAEPGFDVREFMEGARGAYEMLLTAFENGDKDDLRPFLSDEVFTAFSDAIDERLQRQLSVDMRFVGIKSAEPIESTLDPATRLGEITVRYSAEVISVTRNAAGEIVEGDPAAVRRINDVWTYSRTMGGSDPNWTLTATGG